MSSKLSIGLLALGICLAVLPASASAQQQGESEASKSTESGTSENSASDSSGSKETNSKKGTEAGAEAEKGGDADADTTESASKSKEGTSKSGEQAKAGAKDSKNTGSSKSGKGEASEKPKTGPGGQKMRSDYPGTKDAMKEQMDTERIEGLQFKEGGEPAQAYDVQIQQLETKIDDLKEKVFQSKSRVVLLKETVLGGNLSGSRAMIVHSNDLGSQFQLRRAMYSLDGNRVFNESKKTGKTVDNKKFKVYDGNISAGMHNVSVLLRYRGNGYGVFNYMEGYDFKITSSCQFKAEPGKATVLRVRSVNKAGAFADVEKKPGIKCEIETRDLSEEQSESDGKNNRKAGASGTDSSGESGSDTETGSETN